MVESRAPRSRSAEAIVAARYAKTVEAHLEGLASWGLTRLGADTGGDSAETEPVTPDLTSRRADETEVVRVLDQCRSEVAACVACRLSETRTQTVFGVGDPRARLMFVGEAPGADEDRQGEPFVGRAGQLLNRIIVALGLRREDVYIANVLKCRPPGNRDPHPEEVASCTRFLERQIDAIAPEMIVALGKPAANFLLGTSTALGRLRGRIHRYRGTPVIATYHPAYLLRNPDAKRDTWRDLQVVIDELELDPPRR